MRLVKALIVVAAAAFAAKAHSETVDPQALLAALSPALGGDCALADPPPKGAEVLAMMGAPAAWGALCPAEGRAVFAAALPAEAAAGRWLDTLAMQLLLTNDGRPVSLADLTGQVLISVAAGQGGALAIDRAPLPDPAKLPGLLFSGQESADWLPIAYAGGSFEEFARYDSDAFLADVPTGHGWGNTGIYSAAPVVPVPDFGQGKAVRLRLQMDPAATTGAIFALIPAERAGQEEWGAHVLRLGYVEPEGAANELVLWERQQELGRFTVTDKAVLKDLSLWLRPDGSLTVSDASGAVLIQAPMTHLTAGSLLHLYALASAPNPEEAVALRLTGLRLEVVDLDTGPDPAAALGDAPETAVLFDGTLSAPHFARIWAHGGDFARDARIMDGALRVAVAEGNAWGKAGFYSPEPLVWLDRFTDGAEARLAFDFDAAETTGFMIALSGTTTMNGNDPSLPRFILAWRKGADGIVRALRHLDYDQDLLEVEVPQGMPARVELVLTPMGIQVQAPGFPDEVLPWPLLAEGRGLRLSIYSHPAAENLPVSMVLKRIELTRTPGRDPGEPIPGVGAEPLPEITLFDGKPDPAWVPFSLVYDKTFDDLTEYRDGWLVAEVPAIGGWGRTGLLSDKPLMTFDRRLQITPYRLRYTLDPDRTDGFATLVSTVRAEDMWGQRNLHIDLTRMIRGPRAGQWKLTVNSSNGDWTRYFSPAWMAAHWDGRLEVEFGDGWARAVLPGAVSIRGTAPIYVFGEFHVLMQSVAAGDYDGARMAVARLTGGWVTPRLMDPIQRMQLLDDADFDPAAFLDLLGADLSEDLP
ncbi:hypothetical protein LHP98_00995 [Rhodobacter sp. Har01]|uniref:hypothetical protein n=1 Tax=Rhodobacter sp. Har01 TaxID=2883999 RepID=UPI001D0629CC|nr:hypothetical protein [Rhodobacter sp. Har01]MCB6176703.1 hypothetical protein [Rhodobacter sp. Har01]